MAILPVALSPKEIEALRQIRVKVRTVTSLMGAMSIERALAQNLLKTLHEHGLTTHYASSSQYNITSFGIKFLAAIDSAAQEKAAAKATVNDMAALLECSKEQLPAVASATEPTPGNADFYHVFTSQAQTELPQLDEKTVAEVASHVRLAPYVCNNPTELTPEIEQSLQALADKVTKPVAPTLENVEMKIEVLSRLALILDMTIAQVLDDVIGDYQKLRREQFTINKAA